MTELTPAQKGAITRAKNKAAREVAAAAEAKLEADKAEALFGATNVTNVVNVINDAAEVVDEFTINDPFVELTISEVTPRIPANVRNGIYIGGIVVGALTTAAGTLATVLQGDPQLIAIAISGLGLSLTNLLAKLNLSRPASEVDVQALG